MEYIKSENAPQAVGPYSQAVKAGDFLFISGQLPVTKEGLLIDEYIYNQTIQCLKNIEAIINSAGKDIDSITKITIYLTNLKNFQLVNEAYADFFKNGNFPARSTVEARNLPKGMEIEIDAIAYLG